MNARVIGNLAAIWGPPALVLGLLILVNWLLVQEVQRWNSQKIRVVAECDRKVIISEGDGTAEIRIRLDGPKVAYTVGVRAETKAESASDQKDFQPFSKVLKLSPDGRAAILQIRIIDDGVVEPPEEFHLILTDPDGIGLECPPRIVVQIQDNDTLEIRTPLREITIQLAPIDLELPFQLGNPCERALDISFSTRSGTAYEDLDFETAKGNLHLEPLQKQFTIPIRVQRSSVVETRKQFWVDLVATADDASLWYKTQIAITLHFLGSDAAIEIVTSRVQLSPTQLSPNSGGFAPVIFRLSKPLPAETPFRVETEDDSAVAGKEYEPIKKTLRFGAGQTDVKEYIKLLPCEHYGETRSFWIRVTEINGVQEDALKKQVVIEYPPPPPRLRVEPNTVEIAPARGEKTEVRIALDLDRSPQHPARLRFKTEEKTARAMEHFLPIEGQLIFDKDNPKHVLALTVFGLPCQSESQTLLIKLLDPQYLQLTQDSIPITIRPPATLKGDVLVIFPITASLRKSDLVSTITANLPRGLNLVGSCVWLLDGLGEVTSFRGDNLKTLPYFDDNDYQQALRKTLDAMLNQSVCFSFTKAYLVWYSEFNPDLDNDISVKIPVPESPTINFVWVRSQIPGEQRISKRLVYWFKGRVRFVSPDDYQQIIAEIARTGSGE